MRNASVRVVKVGSDMSCLLSLAYYTKSVVLRTESSIIITDILEKSNALEERPK